ncbi:MAG: HK97-gp10 family putative phage morphogenesis protein [Peptoniphilaceae bacterium]|nr:hypothetical protein [Peptoniphilaceae bacterium]MDD7542760.1 hypothetical protein [Peptoniphilaceae bacterium]MDY3987343.1 HK97-gp10 family putative phage morphogenesis protein [Peptoniphilaceae bacterium]MDY4196701.1 HK97-gp10 family putative phage morphogenesis protein [Peptoniphilaceae bacterium]MDY5765961.1 HK97-gp10 family putative phage morphogenesis protein [Peptoniphilaceae bacterium]
MIQITLSGVDALKKALSTEQVEPGLQEVVRTHGAKLQSEMMRRAVFRGHREWRKGKGWVFVKPTGTTKRSIRLHLANNQLQATVAPGTHYSAYLELGTRYMSAQPFVFPALKVVQGPFVKEIQRMIKIGGKR